MKNFKFKFLIPVLAIAFALTSAFATSESSEVDEFAESQQAYIINNNVCEEAVECSPQGNFACTSGAQDAYGKLFPEAPTCSVILRKNTP